jgi:hypothetical protein
MRPPTLAERLSSPAPPWVHLVVADDVPRALLAPPSGLVVRMLDGRRCQTKGTLLAEMARVLAFPAYFGRSWDALEDCLTDLAWLPGRGYILGITRAEGLLRRTPDEYGTLIDVLDSVGRAWATGETGHPDRGPVAFHSVLVVSERGFAKRLYWRLPRAGA